MPQTINQTHSQLEVEPPRPTKLISPDKNQLLKCPGILVTSHINHHTLFIFCFMYNVDRYTHVYTMYQVLLAILYAPVLRMLSWQLEVCEVNGTHSPSFSSYWSHSSRGKIMCWISRFILEYQLVLSLDWPCWIIVLGKMQ